MTSTYDGLQVVVEELQRLRVNARVTIQFDIDDSVRPLYKLFLLDTGSVLSSVIGLDDLLAQLKTVEMFSSIPATFQRQRE